MASRFTVGSSEGPWNGPRFQDAVYLEAKVVMQLGRAVLLHDKHSAGLRSLLSRPGSGVLSNSFFSVLSLAQPSLTNKA